MERNVSFNQSCDVFVIGGGINGAAVAHDAASRGLSVVLAEKGDFASGTSSASSKLAHGGLRYLKNFELGMVRDSLKERKILQKIAPHLVKPLKFVIPLYESKFVMHAGMVLYDLLSFDKRWHMSPTQLMPSHEVLSPKDVRELEPNVLEKNLTGGVSYFDCQISSPERLCLEYLLSASSNGASVANYVRVDHVEKGKVELTDLTNNSQGVVYPKHIVNCAGPWVDSLRKDYVRDFEPMSRSTKGIHVITKKISNNAVVLKANKRNFFILPWNGKSLIGTTDTSYEGSLDNVVPTRKDMGDLIDEVNSAFNVNLDLEADVLYAYAGIRPLVNSGEKETEVSRKYDVSEENGVITVVGGKLTTARGLAEEVVNKISDRECVTHSTPLFNGSRCHLDVEGEVFVAVENEMALTLEDVLLRRTDFGTSGYPGLVRTEYVAKLMGEFLGWSDARRITEINNYKNSISRCWEK